MKGNQFPLWQIDAEEYSAVCAHLGLSPRDHLYERLSRYLGEMPFRRSPPEGFAHFLAGPRLTRSRVACLDLASKLFMPGHPIRHVLNGTIALHECDGRAYEEMSRSAEGWRVWLAMVLAGLGFALRSVLAFAWLAWQWMVYVSAAAWRTREDLSSAQILITGVHRGLGMDLMLHCLERGARVIGTVRNAQAAADVRKWLPAPAPVTLLVADLSQPQGLVAALGEAGIRPESLRLTILCAGTKHAGASVVSLPDLRSTFEVNCFSVASIAGWLCGGHTGSAEAFPAMAAAAAPAAADPGRGGIARRGFVVVSSMGRWHGMPGTGGYNASKAALSIWAESFDMELRRDGDDRLSVTIVEPGVFESDMMRTTTLARWLFVPRRAVASRIVSAGIRGKPALRPPAWFALLTWCVCLSGRRVRSRLFAGTKSAKGRP